REAGSTPAFASWRSCAPRAPPPGPSRRPRQTPQSGCLRRSQTSVPPLLRLVRLHLIAVRLATVMGEIAILQRVHGLAVAKVRADVGELLLRQHARRQSLDRTVDGRDAAVRIALGHGRPRPQNKNKPNTDVPHVSLQCR